MEPEAGIEPAKSNSAGCRLRMPLMEIPFLEPLDYSGTYENYF